MDQGVRESTDRLWVPPSPVTSREHQACCTLELLRAVVHYRFCSRGRRFTKRSLGHSERHRNKSRYGISTKHQESKETFSGTITL